MRLFAEGGREKGSAHSHREGGGEFLSRCSKVSYGEGNKEWVGSSAGSLSRFLLVEMRIHARKVNK